MMNRCAELIVERAGSRHPNNFLTASSRSLIQPQRRGFKGVKILMPSQSELSELLGSAATDRADRADRDIQITLTAAARTLNNL